MAGGWGLAKLASKLAVRTAFEQRTAPCVPFGLRSVRFLIRSIAFGLRSVRFSANSIAFGSICVRFCVRTPFERRSACCVRGPADNWFL